MSPRIAPLVLFHDRLYVKPIRLSVNNPSGLASSPCTSRFGMAGVGTLGSTTEPTTALHDELLGQVCAFKDAGAMHSMATRRTKSKLQVLAVIVLPPSLNQNFSLRLHCETCGQS